MFSFFLHFLFPTERKKLCDTFFIKTRKRFELEQSCCCCCCCCSCFFLFNFVFYVRETSKYHLCDWFTQITAIVLTVYRSLIIQEKKCIYEYKLRSQTCFIYKALIISSIGTWTSKYFIGSLPEEINIFLCLWI